MPHILGKNGGARNSRLNDGNPNAKWCDFLRQAFAQTLYRPLGRGVDHLSQGCDPAGYGTDIHDVSGSLFTHRGKYRLGTADDAPEVRIEDDFGFLDVDILKCRVHANPGIVDEDIDGARVRKQFSQGLLDRVVAIHIEFDGPNIRLLFCSQFQKPLGLVEVAHTCEDLVAACAKVHGGGPSNT